MPARPKLPLALLALTALVASRTTLALFDDPEGPNLLIVVVAAAAVFALSLPAYAARPSARGFWLAVGVQVAVAGVAYWVFG